jgi:tRNA 2-thiouridine synthesizing protein E
MALVVDGMEIQTTDNGYLVNTEDWNEGVMNAIAAEEGIEMTKDHIDVIEFLRDRYFNHAGDLPNLRNIIKGMGEIWTDRKVDSKSLFDLFPLNPSKQAGRIAGLPESMRKGGY